MKMEDLLFPADTQRLQALAHAVQSASPRNALFPEYTLHETVHAERVINLLDQGLPDDCKRRLSPREAFILLACAYLHDIGVVSSTAYHDRFTHAVTSAWIAAALLHDVGYLSQLSVAGVVPPPTQAEYARRSHSKILEERDRLGLTEEEARIVGRVCGAHSIPAVAASLPTDEAVAGENVRERLIASLLRFADDLEVAAPRAAALAGLLVLADELQEWGRVKSGKAQLDKAEFETIARVKGAPALQVAFAPRKKAVLLRCQGSSDAERRLGQHVARAATAHVTLRKKDFDRIKFPYRRVELVAQSEGEAE